MASRYSKFSFIQPKRSIAPAGTDILYTFKKNDNVDNLAQKYYEDPTLGWIIMCANPDHLMEFQIPIGAIIRIPMPLERVYKGWGDRVEI